MNARAPLLISTPDGSGQAVHPDVVHIPDGFGGYEYWMAFTPYPFGISKLENPCVRASRDGFIWDIPVAAPDPVVPAPPGVGQHHADTDLAYKDGRLYLVYMTTTEGAAAAYFSVVSTADGRYWTPPTIILTDDWIVSPCLFADERGWCLWYVQCNAGDKRPQGRIYLRKGAALENLGAPELCRLEIPGHVLWHLDVVKAVSGYEGLVTAFPLGSDPSRSRLFHVASEDGIIFQPTMNAPLLTPSLFGWDNRFIYRSTMLLGCGEYRIWYSAGSWAARHGIGYLSGPLDSLTENNMAVKVCLRKREGSLRIMSGCFGIVKYAIIRVLPMSMFRSLQNVRNALRKLL